jgi:hypothetical protein
LQTPFYAKKISQIKILNVEKPPTLEESIGKYYHLEIDDN